MAAMLAVVLAGVLLSLPRTNWARRRRRRAFRELFAKTRAINLLAAARIFLFGSRDVWFVVGLPVFLYGYGWKYMGWQASSPPGPSATGGAGDRPDGRAPQPDGLSREIPAARVWGAVLTAIPVALRC